MTRTSQRSKSGAVLPIVVVATLLLVAYLAFSVDVTRNILAVQKLQFAAESAGLDALAKVTNSNGQYTIADGLSNAQIAVASSHGSAPWNSAPVGPADQQGPYNSGVTINSSDVASGSNPADPSEPVLRVTARRDGAQALKFFFLPAIFAMDLMNGGAVPADAASASPYRTIEVIGAPASRVGAGAPRTAALPSSLAGWAVLPLAISYSQFGNASSPSETRLNYDLDLLDSTSPYQANAQPNRIRAAFVNVVHEGAGSGYYGSGQGNVAINQLVSTVKYFSNAVDVTAVPPGVVERGSRLALFDCGDATFRSRRTELALAVQTMPTSRKYIIPVISGDPIVGQQATVIGFAYLRMPQTVRNNPGQGNSNPFIFQVEFGDSLPARNATSGTMAAVPNISDTLLPAPVAGGPFANRTMDLQANSLSRRFRGVCMAPVTSARSL